MTAGDIARAALWVADWEGPYHVTPGDAGGPTAWGIALNYHPGMTIVELQQMTMQDGATFLARNYVPYNAILLPAQITTPLLAFSVLEGAGVATKVLQRALGVAQDGDIGPETSKAAHALPVGGNAGLLVRFNSACNEHLETKPGWPIDGAGWANRGAAAIVAALTA